MCECLSVGKYVDWEFDACPKTTRTLSSSTEVVLGLGLGLAPCLPPLKWCGRACSRTPSNSWFAARYSAIDSSPGEREGTV